jgi:multiple sugar transport system permease protein
MQLHKTNNYNNRGLDRFGSKVQPYLYLLPAVILLVMFLFVPIIMVIRYSFYNNVIINHNPIWVGLANYKAVLSDDVFIKASKDTAVFVLLNVIFHLIIGMTLALMVNAKSLGPGPKAVFRVIYLLPWMFNATVIAILWKLLLNPSGLVNYIMVTLKISDLAIEFLSNRSLALWVLTFINIWAGYPFYMISILAGFQGISPDLYEAASIDGANSTQKFSFITIPQLKPILISIALLDVIWTTQTFSLIWLLTGGGPAHATEMMSTYVYKTAFQSFKYSKASASAVIILLACVILAIFYVRNQTRDD